MAGCQRICLSASKALSLAVPVVVAEYCG